MANRINININSRIYTVVADEDTQYLQDLCDYVNSKVNLVISEGQHVMGEKPVVLAALNICDEYFKLLNSKEPAENVTELLAENKKLEEEIRYMKKAETDSTEKTGRLEEELKITNRILEETEEKVKFLEGQIKLKENQMLKQRSEFALREKELLDMIESK